MKHTHLDALKIRGFRGLSSLDLDGLGTFNILLGANDVGKTSILEAIFILSGSANMQLPLQIQTFRNYGVREFADLYALFHKLLEFSREQHLQIFATTHSREILKALKDVLNSPEFSGYRQTTNCYVLQRDKSGLVRSYKYEYHQYEHNIEHDIEIR